MNSKRLTTGFGTRKTRFDLTTMRNHNLITAQQQLILRKTVVGFFGLSVGSHAALTWMMESRANIVKIADPDTIEPTNLNRLRFGWETVGKRKTEVVKEQLLTMNPDAEVFVLNSTNDQEIKMFVQSPPTMKCIVDETDNFSAKILLRQIARRHRIPVLTATDVGDNVFLDIERYDLSPQPKPFQGRLGDVEHRDLDRLQPNERMKLALQYVGLEHNSEAMLYSLLSIGKTLPTWPQLGATATVAGGVITTAMKKILLGERINTRRYIISLDDLLVKDYSSRQKTMRRAYLKQLVADRYLS